MLAKRWKAKTPKFWKKVQAIGIGLGLVGGAILSAPVTLPAAIVSVGGYLVTIGSVSATLSQLTIEDGEVRPKEDKTSKAKQ
jgi:hypothetical protein